MTELNRFLRHSFAPLVMWLVAKGYLPDYMETDVLEAIVIGASVIIPIALSKIRESKK